jgi:hypothetical protein
MLVVTPEDQIPAKGLLTRPPDGRNAPRWHNALGHNHGGNMSRFGKTVAALASSIVVLAPLSVAGSAEAATHFANCTAMHRVYKHGVSKSASAANYQVRQGYGRPAVKPAFYAANVTSDRDKDGTACEA